MRRRFLHEGCLEPGKPSGLSRGTPKPSSEHADGKILLLCPKPVNAHFWCNWWVIGEVMLVPGNQIPPGPCFTSGWSHSSLSTQEAQETNSQGTAQPLIQLTMPRSRHQQPAVKQSAAAQQCLHRSFLWSGGYFAPGIAPTLTKCAGPRYRPPPPGENQGT